MTRDLRRRVLESHKTVSKKAASRIGSKTTSAANSRTQSRNVSRHASDEEDGNLSDDDSTTWSVNSVDDVLDTQEPHEASDTWAQELNDRIEEIIDRKRSSEEGRERALMAYNHYLMLRYCYDEIESKIAELYPALCKSIKAETGEKEACLALRAVGLTVITHPSEDVYEDIFRTLKQAYQRSEHITVKAAAIRAIAALATYGGASESEISEIMDEFLEIVESDGNSVDAPDSAEVVTAACEEWGSLATFVDDLEEISEAAMEAFVDQLESSSTSVRIAAGENIALIYEKSYSPRESDDPDATEHEKVDEHGFPLDVSQVKRYEPFRQKSQLEHTLSELAKASSKSISKKDRKTLHATFGDVLATIKYPVRGPKYSNVIDEDGHLLGSRMFVRIHKSGVMKIDKWWKLHRLQALRRVLGGGFMTHYQHNEVILQSLPTLITRS
ncbi:hypothetical protein DSL72_001331 [Monilinia vaccinii-corymbosi]|uniref:Interferon-related developmental regulator N-terminal domain-containing protein n=1 Tax=Monilinia vaccinii-corymbosi TaxID=61207 RepID=A0A8A3P3N1_9HELO|nr:hypothetical protein DSL72_001331 [Monilinia vaccinii-corymbosi]